MNLHERAELIDFFYQNFCRDTLCKKGADYVSAEKEIPEANSNFSEVSKRLGNKLDDIEVWTVYYMKHQLALENWLKNREVKSEPIIGRIVDLINYLFILVTMLYDKKAVDLPSVK